MNVLNLYLMQDALQAGVQIYARLGHIRAMKKDLERYSTVNPRVPEFLEEIDTLVDNSVGKWQSYTVPPPCGVQRHTVLSNVPRFSPWPTLKAHYQIWTFSAQSAPSALISKPALNGVFLTVGVHVPCVFIGTEGTEFSVIEFSASS